jgi:hypothetical protein
MGHRKGSPKGKFYRYECIYLKKIGGSLINVLMLHLNLPEKQEQAKPKTSRRRQIIKIRLEPNEIDTKYIYIHTYIYMKNQQNKKLIL